jgi:Ca2+-dependent lipid-binding protein
MSTALHQLTISEISCRNLRSADMFGKNDVYVVFRVGTKKVKTHHKKNAGKHASFDEILTMNLNDSDLEHGIDVGAYDYDVGSSDDLLGQGKLVNLLALKRTPNAPRQFKEPFKCKAVWKSTSASGAPDNSSLSHFSAMARPGPPGSIER